MRSGPDPPILRLNNALRRLLGGDAGDAEEEEALMQMPAVTVRPDPERYGSGRVYRARDGHLRYNSPNTGPDGRRATHRLAVIGPRLAPGQTVEEFERQIIESEPVPGTDAVERSLETLNPTARTAVERLLAEASRAGVRLYVNETRRPQARQDALFRQGRDGRGMPVTWTLTSNHALGNAADLVATDDAGYRWIQENAPRFGLGVLGMFDPGHVELREAPQQQQEEEASVDPELERLERALRAAHAAGDEAAARRFAAAIVQRRGAQQPSPIVLDAEGQPLPGQTRGEVELARLHMEQGGVPGTEEDVIRLRGTYDPENLGEASTGPIGQARAKWMRGELLSTEEADLLGFPSPEKARREWEAEQARARGRASVRPEDREGLNAAAAVQGFGSGFFGLGTPATAATEFVTSRFDDEPGESTWGESLEFARGRRDQLRESHPEEFYTGVAGSLVGSIGALRAAGRVVPSVFTLQSGQTARNVRNLMVTGAGLSGVTALNEEGTAAVPGAMATGAVAGPAFAGAVRGAQGGARAIASRISPDNTLTRHLPERIRSRLGPDNPAIRLLAKRLGEPVETVQRRYDEFVRVRGRPPRLAEIVRQETSEDFGQISRNYPQAGALFRQAEESAARALPGELAPLVHNGGMLEAEAAAAARRAATTQEAANVVGRRVRSSTVQQVGQRGVTQDGGQRGRVMDRAMETIRDQRVPVTDDMLEVIQNPDLSAALKPVVRRRVLAAIEAAGDDTPYLTVGEWDMIRRDLTARARTPSSVREVYRAMGERVRDYVSRAVPEYDTALREFYRRSSTARGTQIGGRILTESTREFVDLLQSLNPATRAGVRVGARTAIAEALGGDPAKAERFMERLARDPGMRARVRAALRKDEAVALEQLAQRYGHSLDFSTGLRTGRSVLQQSDTEAFQEAVRRGGVIEREGVARGARTALTEAAGESPAAASRTAQRMAEDPGLQTRIATALGNGEQRRLAALGQSVTESERRLAEAAPGGASLAAARAKENAEGIQRVIQAGVVATGRFSGGFLGNFTNAIVQRTRLSKAAARRLAELATDPARAHMVIARLRRAGVESDAILRMYQEAAAAAGIQVGRAGDTPESTRQ